MLSIKNLIFKKRLVKKLTKRYIELYIVEEIVLKNMIKIKLLTFIRIYLVVNISKIVRYKESVREQKVEKPKLIKK